MGGKKKPRATVHDLTAERARAGTLPWSFDVDIAANHFVMKVHSDATPVDVAAMAKALESWSRTLAKAARQLRASLKG